MALSCLILPPSHFSQRNHKSSLFTTFPTTTENPSSSSSSSKLLSVTCSNGVHKQFRRPYMSVMIVPTGVGASIGGYAGDALPVARTMASVVDCLISHPNVLNAAMLYWPMPNALYVEGYALDRFAEGSWALQPVHQNKIGLVLDAGIEEDLKLRHLQVADATRASLGLPVVEYITTDRPLMVQNWIDPTCGKSTGRIRNTDSLLRAVDNLISQADVNAIAVVGRFPDDDLEEIDDYRLGKGVDLLAGVEAIISHLVVKEFVIPCAHAPALPSASLSTSVSPKSAAEEIQTKRRSNLDPERLSKLVFIKYNKAIYEIFQKRRFQNKNEDYDPIVLDDLNYSSEWMTGRIGACNEFVYEEGGLTWVEIGHTFLPCVLAGLSNAPQYIVLSKSGSPDHGCVTASNVDSVVLPIDACGGDGALAFARQSKALIIAVGENETVLDDTPDKLGIEAVKVSNYWEAIGVIAAHKAGVDPKSLRRNGIENIARTSKIPSITNGRFLSNPHFADSF